MTRLPTGIDIGTAGYGTGGPRVNGNAQLVGDAINAIAAGAGAYASNVTARLQREQQTEINRLRQIEAQRKFEEEQAEAIARQDEIVGRGVAIQDLADHLPKIETGDEKFVVPDGPLGPWANGYINSLTEGMSDAAKASYRQYALPKLLESANKQRENLKKAADGRAIEAVKRVAGTAQSPEEMQRFAQILVDSGVAPDAARAEVGVKTLKAAVDMVSAGVPPERARAVFDMASSYLGGLEGPERDTIARELVNFDSRVKAQRTDRHKAGFDWYTLRSTDESLSTQVLRNDLGRLLKEDRIDEQTYRSELNALGERDKKLYDKEIRLSVLQQKDSARRGAIDFWKSQAINARSTGGLARVDDVTVEIENPMEPGGTETLTIKGDEIAEIVMDEVLPTLQTFGQQAQFSAENGVAFPQWQKVLTAGPSAGMAAFVAADGKDVQLPANLVDGYNLYTSLRNTAGSIGPTVLNIHVPDSATRLFYERVDFARRYMDGGDLNKALLRTMQINDEQPFTSALKLSPGKYGVDNLVGDGPNAGEAVGTIEQIAKFLMATGGDESDAVKQAKRMFEDTHTKVNKTWVYTGDRRVPQDPAVLREAAARITSDFLYTNDLTQTHDIGDYTLMPGPTPTSWLLWDVGMSSPAVDKDGQARLYSTPELEELGAKIVEERRNLAASGVQTRPAASRPPLTQADIERAERNMYRRTGPQVRY